MDTKITRIDIALDELIVEGKENFDLYSLKEKMEHGLVHTRFKNFDFSGGFSYEKDKWSIKACLYILAVDNLRYTSTSIKKILN